MKNLIIFVFVFIAAAGCSNPLDELDQEIEDSLNPDEPFACGEDLCQTDEMCVRRQDALFISDIEDTYTCEDVPSGCETDFCDCDATATDTTYDSLDIIGCSAMGERHLTLAVVTCGDTACSSGEYCLEDNAAVQTCNQMPEGCSQMCGEGCGAVGETFESGTVQGCSSYSVTIN